MVPGNNNRVNSGTGSFIMTEFINKMCITKIVCLLDQKILAMHKHLLIVEPLKPLKYSSLF